jgi:hypothetical protein
MSLSDLPANKFSPSLEFFWAPARGLACSPNIAPLFKSVTEAKKLASYRATQKATEVAFFLCAITDLNR